MSSLAKISVTGRVENNPEKRYTDDNLAIASFMINFGFDDQEKHIRVFSLGRVADRIAETVKKGQNILVEGRLQTNVKNEDGVDKKFVEISASGIEVLGAQIAGEAPQAGNQQSDDLIGEDEIPF